MWNLAPKPDTAPIPPQLLGLENTLEKCIEDAIAAGLLETAALLHMAKLDLLTKIHGITDEEFEVLLCTAHRIADEIRRPVPSQPPMGKDTDPRNN